MRGVQTMGFIGIPLALLAVGIAINHFRLFSYLGNLTMPWLLVAVAISLLLVGGVCVVTGRAPHELPTRVRLGTVVAVQTIYGVGMLVDRFAYRAPPADW